MAVALLQDPPVSPSSLLGPYRRRDYEALSEEPRCELIYGSFQVSPSPSPLHQTLLLLLARTLQDRAWDSGGRIFVAPLDVALADHSIVQPDLIYLSRERRKLVGDRIEGAPDLLVEVLSPGKARRDRGEKLRLYGEAGVREYWIVDPVERQIEFLQNEDGRFVVALPEDGMYRSSCLPEVELDLTLLWAALDRDLAV